VESAVEEDQEVVLALSLASRMAVVVVAALGGHPSHMVSLHRSL